MPAPALYEPGARTIRRRRFGAADTTAAVGGLAVAPVLIPYAWLALGVAWWPERPRTSVTVSRTGGTTVERFNAASTTEYGDVNYPATLDSACDADPASLAGYILTYWATQPGAVPRQRFLSLPLVALNARTTAEQQLILSVPIGRRISITNPPATWPVGLSEQVIEGISHSIGDQTHIVTWRTLPVVGAVAGVAGPWFRLDSSAWDGPDVIPF